MGCDELAQLEEVAARVDWEREIAVRLMGKCGLCAEEVNYPSDAELRWSEKGEGGLFEAQGKNNRGGDPKVRDV